MANTTNYGWETPDDTDLVKDGAAAIRTLGSAVDTTTKALNPETTLGDIAYRSATANTNTRLAVGSNGQVLTVASGVPSWATPSDQTPLTTKGDLFTFSTSDARLPVGTNGYTLVADSAEATGLKWAAPAASGFVGCSVYKSSAQTLTNNAETALTFDTENFDTSAFHSTTTNTSRMTIPSGKAGYYLVVTTVTFASNSTPARAVTLRKNGSEHAYLQQIQPVSNGGSITNGTYILNLAENDYIEIYVRQESGGNLNTGSGSAGPSFTIQYLGA